jgi:hypothetical protein
MSDILKVTILFNVFQVFLSTGLEKYRYHGNGVPTVLFLTVPYLDYYK